jgi:hypothetical protein
LLSVVSSEKSESRGEVPDSITDKLSSHDPGQSQHVLFAYGVFRKACAEHGSFAFRLFFCGFILNYIPMLDEDSVLDAHDIRGNPIHRSTETAESAVHDHEVSLGHDRSRFVLQRWRDALDKVEKTLAARRDMSAVLNVVRDQ